MWGSGVFTASGSSSSNDLVNGRGTGYVMYFDMNNIEYFRGHLNRSGKLHPNHYALEYWIKFK